MCETWSDHESSLLACGKCYLIRSNIKYTFVILLHSFGLPKISKTTIMHIHIKCLFIIYTLTFT